MSTVMLNRYRVTFHTKRAKSRTFNVAAPAVEMIPLILQQWNMRNFMNRRIVCIEEITQLDVPQTPLIMGV